MKVDMIGLCHYCHLPVTLRDDRVSVEVTSGHWILAHKVCRDLDQAQWRYRLVKELLLRFN